MGSGYYGRVRVQATRAQKEPHYAQRNRRDTTLDLHFRITGPVILTYLFVSVLHGLWDGLPSTIYLIVPPGFHIPLVTLVLSVIGITVFSLMFRRATVQTISPPTPVNP